MFGDNGVLTQADNATSKTEKAAVEEALQRAVVGAQGDFITYLSTHPNAYFIDWLGKSHDATSGEDDESTNYPVLKESGYTIDPGSDDYTAGTIKKGDKGKVYNYTISATSPKDYLAVNISITE